MSRLQAVVADVLEIAPEEVREDFCYNSAPGWDSLNHISLMLALEDEFDLVIPDDQVIELTTLRAIREFMVREGKLP
jgi:acyl carrier protein